MSGRSVILKTDIISFFTFVIFYLFYFFLNCSFFSIFSNNELFSYFDSIPRSLSFEFLSFFSFISSLLFHIFGNRHFLSFFFFILYYQSKVFFFYTLFSFSFLLTINIFHDLPKYLFLLKFNSNFSSCWKFNPNTNYISRLCLNQHRRVFF